MTPIPQNKNETKSLFPSIGTDGSRFQSFATQIQPLFPRLGKSHNPSCKAFQSLEKYFVLKNINKAVMFVAKQASLLYKSFRKRRCL